MKQSISFKLNGEPFSIEVNGDESLLTIMRTYLDKTGTKFGCGVSQCGACSVLINGNLTKSCSIPVSYAEGKEIFTIEGSSENLEFLRAAWNEGNVPQCGYCQSGQLIAATALLDKTANPTNEDIDKAMSGNICRCGTYTRIRKAIHKAVELKTNSHD